MYTRSYLLSIYKKNFNSDTIYYKKRKTSDVFKILDKIVIVVKIYLKFNAIKIKILIIKICS